MKRRLVLLMTCMLFSIGLALAQNKRISGTVVDNNGQALTGATVLVKGTTTGVSTDIDGKFSISISPKAKTLVVSLIGSKTKEVAVGENLKIVLENDDKTLDEVVVTALGISKEKKALGYSVQNIGNDQISKTGESNIINTLAAKAAGVQVISSSGVPGASTKILIRGNSSFTGENQPLIVVDGVPLDNSTNETVAGDYAYNSNLSGVNNTNRALDINPDDIESVSILKGPAAAALYGARAGNGAIIYTTKRGTLSGPRVVYSFNADFDVVGQLPDEQKEYAQGGFDGNGVITYQPGATPNSWGPKISTIDGAKIYDNTKDFFRTGVGYNHNLSINGGNEKNIYRFSLSHLDQDGMMPNTDYKRTTARLNVDSKITDRLTANSGVTYTHSSGIKAQNGSTVSGAMLTLFRAPVTWNLADWKNEDGSSNNYYSNYDNPYWSAYNNPFTDENDRWTGNTTLKYNVFSWLDVSYKLGVDTYTNKTKQIYAIGSNNIDDGEGEIDEQTWRYQQFYQDVVFSAKKSFLNEHLNTSLDMGGNLTHEHTESLFGRATQLNIPNFYNLSNGSTLYSDEKQTTIRTSALFFSANIDWKNYLFLAVTGRNEWSSTFGAEKNNFFYPSVSASFIFTEFVPKNDILSYGKFRMARAAGGNSPSAYSSKTYYVKPYFADGSTDGNSFPFLGQNGFTYNNVLGNANLKPEKTIETEIGTDLKFFKSRLGLELTYYNKETSDILVQRPIAGSSGFQAIIANSGKMRNRGIEILVNADPIKTKSFQWNINANFTKNNNKVLALADGVDEIDIESAFQSIASEAIVGQPYGALYATRWARNDAGQLIIGSNGLPEVADTRGNLGNPFPDWTAGIRNTFSYKGFTLSAMFDFRHGGKIWNGTIARMNRLGRTAESADRERTYIISGVKEDGSPNDIAISAFDYFSSYKGDGTGSATENSIFSGSWARLRELSISYKYNFKTLKWLKFVEVSLIGRNLWLDTKYPGVDPETSLTGAGSNLTGFDYFNNPGSRTYSFGLKFGIL